MRRSLYVSHTPYIIIISLGEEEPEFLMEHESYFMGSFGDILIYGFICYFCNYYYILTS